MYTIQFQLVDPNKEWKVANLGGAEVSEFFVRFEARETTPQTV